MLLRLFLALLVASFALPAAAAAPACHEPAAMSGMHHRAPPAPEKAPPAHVCVGCAALADWDATRITARLAPAAAPTPARVVQLDLGGTIAPALPPPRIA